MGVLLRMSVWLWGLEGQHSLATLFMHVSSSSVNRPTLKSKPTQVVAKGDFSQKYAPVYAVVHARSTEEALLCKKMETCTICCYCITKEAKTLHAYINRARLTACEVSKLTITPLIICQPPSLRSDLS